ncbi:MAG: sulfite exporter TauE/SafE family protein [Chitinophagaceae bacterium]
MQWQILVSAFGLGLLSSFHCVGMCGAIAFSLPTQHLAPAKKITGIILYNTGRILMYALMGILFGVLGRTIYLGGFQQSFSIVAGALILLVLFGSVLHLPFFRIKAFKRFNISIQTLIAKFMGKPGSKSIFLLGMVNGLLPCGLVYLAITGALAVGTIAGAAGFMIAFGGGTFPAMFLLSYFGFLVSVSTRNKMKKMVPFVIGLMGVMLIVRGLGLGIPYLSPVIENHTDTIINCH